jgi:hypothetical protein
VNPSTWNVIAWVGTIILSGAINVLIMGYYIGRYKQELADCVKISEESRKDLVKVREDIARIKGRINGHGWRQEA